MSNLPIDQSGVWRFRELLAFAIVTLREGNTPLLDAPRAAAYAGLDSLTFKHQGFNPTGSFKDNGMTAGSTVRPPPRHEARRLRLHRQHLRLHGRLRRRRRHDAHHLPAPRQHQPTANSPRRSNTAPSPSRSKPTSTRSWRWSASSPSELGIYLLNSVNPFRIEGQKTIMVEMMDQRDWRLPDWVVVPGGNLGNISAFGKAFRELHTMGFIDRLPRFAVVQAEGSAPFSDYFRDRGEFQPVTSPETLATAIRIGDPVSWPKAIDAVDSSSGVVCKVSEQEIADAKAVVGQCGIGCEPASAATLAGLKQLVASGVVDKSADVVAVLTGNVLKDPDYIFKYHTGQLKTPSGALLNSTFGNAPVVVPNEPGRIADIINDRT
jgi:threonine synthase